MRFTCFYLVSTGCLLASAGAFADGLAIDKVYHPYVDALESELELRALVPDAQPGVETPSGVYQLSFGRSLRERWFAELYLIGARSRDGTTDLEAVEVEVKWQLTEQGEYAADWGLLFEYESGVGEDLEEVTLGLLAEKEWGRWSGALNLFLINEWGRDVVDELETKLSLQARYRHSAAFEPALEFYAGQNTRGIGPVVLGNVGLGIRKSLHWEAGLILGLDRKSPDQTWRFLLEYEF